MIALVPGIIPVGNERFKVGDRIRLKFPSGDEAETEIGALEFPHPNPKKEVLVLLRDVGTAEVPPGTEVWSL